MADWSQEFSGVNGAPNVVFIAIAVEFVSDSSRAEIVEFDLSTTTTSSLSMI